MSEKVVRCEVCVSHGIGYGRLDLNMYLDTAFEKGDKVVVILASEYEALRRDASLWRVNNDPTAGTAFPSGTAHKAFLETVDGNNVNAPGTCAEGVSR